MNEHPTDSLPAFVLGALDTEEAKRVAAHVERCPACRSEAEEFRKIIDMLPYSVHAAEPPAHVKRQLFARIEAAREQPHHLRPGLVAQRRGERFVPLFTPGVLRATAAIALIVVVVLSVVALTLRARLNQVTADLEHNQQIIAVLQDQLNQQEELVATLMHEQHQAAVLLSSEDTLQRALVAERPGARARMYMRPGHNQALLVVRGLEPLSPGQTYQFWFATPDHQVPARTFTVDEAGAAEVIIEAPEAVDTYAQVMVTVEQSGGSTTPSDQVVLESAL